MFFFGDTDGASGGVGQNWIYKAVLSRGTSQEEQATSDRHFCSKCSAIPSVVSRTKSMLVEFRGNYNCGTVGDTVQSSSVHQLRNRLSEVRHHTSHEVPLWLTTHAQHLPLAKLTTTFCMQTPSLSPGPHIITLLVMWRRGIDLDRCRRMKRKTMHLRLSRSKSQR